MTIRTTGAQTALRREVDTSEQLDGLLHALGTMNLTLTDVHRLPGPPAVPVVASACHEGARLGSGQRATYEVRVAGELGGPLLRHLRCSHYRIPAQTLVRLVVATSELTRFLRACTDSGATLEGVWRVDAVVATAVPNKGRVGGRDARRQPVD